MKNVIVFLTQNQKLLNQLQSALNDLVVVKTENIEAVNHAAKHNSVGAVVLHITNINGWIIFELLKTGYPDIPCFVILAPSLSRQEVYEREALAAQYGAAGIFNEKVGIAALASMILVKTAPTAVAPLSGKESYLQMYSEISRELLRLHSEFTQTGMRTLPQPEIGADTRERLKSALTGLKNVTLLP